MKFYIKRNKVQVAIMNVEHRGADVYEMTWCHVDPHYRNKGLASDLLNQAMTWADENKFTLIGYADPKPNADMTQTEIDEWLTRHGFTRVRYTFNHDGKGDFTKWVMLREPKVKTA
jgi:GNAT superfamily N-acetyltransferase